MLGFQQVSRAVHFVMRHKKSALVIAVIALVGAGYFFTRSGDSETFETVKVARGVVRSVIEETGVVEASREADIAFELSGTVARVYVKKGSVVTERAPLVVLESAEQSANVLAAMAQVKTEESTLADMRANSASGAAEGSTLRTTELEQEAFIKNARIKLFSDGLEAVPASKSYTQTPPVIGGRYDGPEGTYKIDIERRGIGLTAFEIQVFGLENTKPVEIAKTGATSFGTRGLNIVFPDGVEAYNDTRWYIDIPNTRASTYTVNYNAYIAAKESANTVVAKTEVSAERLQSQEARVETARANLAKAETQLAKRTLRAPFSGIITDVDVVSGELVSPATMAVSLIANDAYEVSVDIPESDIADLTVGDTADVTFDAYDEAVFGAKVVFVAPRAKIVDGVSTVEAVLHFTTQDPRIKAGLSADVSLLANEKKDTLFVPSRAIFEDEPGKTFVRAFLNGHIKEIPVVTGLRGSDGMTEIVEGLSEGDEIISFASEAALKALGENGSSNGAF